MSNLSNPCKYSFKNLVDAAKSNSNFAHEYNLQLLYTLTQSERNKAVKILCNQAGWFYQDIIGKDGILYTAFSPKLIN